MGDGGTGGPRPGSRRGTSPIRPGTAPHSVGADESRPRQRERAARGRAGVAAAAAGARELALFGLALLAYQASRAIVIGDAASAVRHAWHIIDLERAGIFWEPAIQDWATQHPDLVQALNAVYLFAHLPVTAVFFVWLWRSHRDRYRVVRNGFLAGPTRSRWPSSSPSPSPRHVWPGPTGWWTRCARRAAWTCTGARCRACSTRTRRCRRCTSATPCWWGSRSPPWRGTPWSGWPRPSTPPSSS